MQIQQHLLQQVFFVVLPMCALLQYVHNDMHCERTFLDFFTSYFLVMQKETWNERGNTERKLD